jgi:hypothetical protein
MVLIKKKGIFLFKEEKYSSFYRQKGLNVALQLLQPKKDSYVVNVCNVDNNKQNKKKKNYRCKISRVQEFELRIKYKII